ncbi:nitrosoguanidine resistance protein Sng1p [Monosporozyma unispora]|nr:hypothetical protein C6P44_001701 [Kazachstania unispora]
MSEKNSNKSRSNSTTSSNHPSHQIIESNPQLQHVDSDDYLLQNENDVLKGVISEGHGHIDDRVSDGESITDSGHAVDSAAQSMIDSHVSIDSNGSIESYRPSIDDDRKSKQESLATGLEIKRTTTRLWSPKMKLERKKILTQFLRINVVYALFCFTVLVFAWGTVYNTSGHYNKIKILAVLQDDQLSSFETNNNIHPVTEIFPSLIKQTQGNWHIYDESTFKWKYNLQTTEEIDAKIVKLIYDENYWVALNVKPNVTTSMVRSLTVQNQTAFNATDFFQIVYETGRDPAHVMTYMVPLVNEVEMGFVQYCMESFTPSLIKNVTSQNPNIKINWKNLATMMNMQFENVDAVAFTNRILLMSTQVGCTFAILLSIFQFLIYGALHGQVAPLLRKRSRIYYRIFISMVTHFFSSLYWCTVSAMFQVDFTVKFGRGGFMVYWMSTWMYMWACGSANENVISILFAVYPQYLGFWILGFIVCNLTTGFFPMVLNNNFYRIGYIFPLRNMIDLNRSILIGTNSSPSKYGRCYGVFAAWIIISTALLPFVMKWSKQLTIWKAKRVAKQLAEEKEKMNQFT